VWKRLSEKVHVMTVTFVVECINCGGLLLAGISQKTRMCPYCGARVNLQRAKRLARAQDAFEASEILRKIKSERQSNARKLNLK
jgi:anaerobic ribonucleoside-triphosphate reductase